MTTLYANGQIRTPQGLKVSPTSYAALEEIALELRKVLPVSRGERFHLNCINVLEQTLPRAGYNFKVLRRDEVEECAAFTIPDLRLVALREDIYELLHDGNPFGRSTVIHETAHIVLGHAVTLHRGQIGKRHQFYEDSEWQAKALTAAIMMPIEACEAAHSSAELAQLCGTSTQSASYRLERLQKNGRIQRKPNFA